ncbi:GSCFA family protein [Ruegeria marina]|uniref:GSCFA family protein n=2 Tax=Ruegeria marina TaxID=639004 RepID=A0A1G7CGI9_9RHOB|nr:GSCFA family protein [Ruegeria marina]
MKSRTPYSELPARQFWRTAVAEPGPFGLQDLHRPKFQISPDHKIITAGSCFAQTLSRALKQRSYTWLDAEPAPPMMLPETARRYNYGIFSTRTGNIYTVALLRQWLDWAFEPETANQETWLGENGRLYDPVRPTVEPEGFADETAFLAAREQTFASLRQAIRTADILLFTLGLTEAWLNRETGMIYQMCPGTQGGEFDPARHELVNYFSDAILRDFEAIMQRLKVENPDIKVILTVSPVSLTATAVPDSHALVANTYTKSTLRSVAGEATRRWKNVDYFPSYELVAAPAMRGMFYNPNQRTISPAGVDFVMRHFFQSYSGSLTAVPGLQAAGMRPASQDDEPVCNEMILDFYNER